MKTVCFLHAATVGRYQSIVNLIFDNLKSGGLFNFLDRIYINIAGDGPLNLPQDEKIKVIPDRSPLHLFEFTTLNLLKQYSNLKDANVLYLHTKGAGSPDNICLDEWRDYMFYFNIINFKTAIKLLEANNAVGVDLSDEPVKHFSGNIWWSKTSHIKNLPFPSELPVVLSERHKCEFWICSDAKGKYASMHNSGIDVYRRHLSRYPKQNYENIN